MLILSMQTYLMEVNILPLQYFSLKYQLLFSDSFPSGYRYPTSAFNNTVLYKTFSPGTLTAGTSYQNFSNLTNQYKQSLGVTLESSPLEGEVIETSTLSDSSSSTIPTTTTVYIPPDRGQCSNIHVSVVRRLLL